MYRAKFPNVSEGQKSTSDSLSVMRLLVTGGAGKIGRFLIEQLVAQHQVLVLDKADPDVAGVEYVEGDCTALTDVERCCRDMECVVHLAGLKSTENDKPMALFETNVMSMAAVLESARKVGVPKVVFASSDSVLGLRHRRRHFSPDYVPIEEEHPLRPQDPYGLSKAICEQMCRAYASAYGIETMCLRAPSTFCPGDEDVYETDSRAPEARYKSLWAYVHVHDLVQAFEKAIQANGIGHEVFFVSADDHCVEGMSAQTLMREYYPSVDAAGLVGRQSLIDSSKAKQVLGYAPKYTLDDIL